MRFNPIPLIAIGLLIPLTLAAQEDPKYRISLQSGSFTPSPNITSKGVNEFNLKSQRSGGKTFAIIQFEQIPGEAQKKELKQQGIELLDYIPHNAYTATISGNPDAASLLAFKARALFEPSAIQKMQPELALGNFPSHAVKVAGTIDVWISFPRSFSFDEVNQELRARNFDIRSTLWKEYRIIALRVPVQRLGELAIQPFVDYVQAMPGEDRPLSQFWTSWGRDGIRTSLLNAPVANGGKDLKGAGVVVGVGDDADPQQHVDFTNRLISRAAAIYDYHGTHVTGIAGAAGIRNEVRSGSAPRSTIVSQYFSGILTNASRYVSDYGMVITNNSYGNVVNECATFGVYDLYSRVLDQQAFDLPELENVFAAGNSGYFKCPPMPDSFRTVLGGYQSAKNVIVVGNATPIGSIFGQSSRGPVRDGRIKPETVAVGSFIESTAPPPWDFYGENTGTSMAAPAIAGGLALLYEKYRLLHPPGLNPRNGLMKALVCNSGEDWGNPGPDFTHGFGVANFWRAENMLENNHYALGTISTGPPQTIPIVVPAGLAQLKVMLYWNDPPAAPVSTQTLVNDLDLEVDKPDLSTVLPLVLDTASAQIKNNAHNGVDNINNIEQVVIDNPAAGTYTIRIKATNITQNPSQEYFIVYDFLPTETKMITPGGGEAYLQGENVIAQWDSYGTPANTFTLEFSSDNGASWTTLKNNIEANKRHYFYSAPNPNEWFIVPYVTTDRALMRITRNGTGLSSTSAPFVIHDTLPVSLSAIQCEGYFSIEWPTLPGATGYEVMMLRGSEMTTVATVSSSTLSYTFSGLSRDTVYWATVRPLIGASNSPGRRSIAVFRKPDNGTCAGSISDNDIKIDSIISPLRSGRLLTSTALGNNIPVTIQIKNLDDNPTPGNITVGYYLNGAGPVTETITSPAIPAGGTLVHSFAAGIDLSAAGTYELKAFVSQAGDPVPANDTLTRVYKQLNNPPITGINYPTPYIDNFDAAPVQSYNIDQVGLTGLDKYDFVNSNDIGRIRTFINTGIAYSGNRALTLDATLHYVPGVTDSLTGTFNLATYNSATDDIRLDFRYKNHGQGNNAANKVWMRGSDLDNWIEIYDLYANQNPADGSYKFSSSLKLSDFLFNAGPSQNFSTSFQLRWGQYGQEQAADNDGGAGYTFDDIRLYKVTDDMQMINIDTPVVNSCGLSATTPVRITVRNNSNTAAPAVPGVPVRFRINGGPWTTETVPGIAANSSVPYTFTATANLAAPGTYLIETQVLYPTDTYDENDTLSAVITNTPVITVTNASPYLQDFESSNGYWYSSGTNNSWEYGTPASYKINRAASGSKAWKTRMAGDYNDRELSYLYSPCFDISSMSNPTLSLSLALDLEDCGGSLCDGAYVEYSTNGVSWSRLGAYGQGTNWYNKNYSSNNLWSIKNYHRWHVATIPLSVIPVPVNQLTQLHFRFVLNSDASVNRDGVAIDDIHIYSNDYGIYDGPTMGAPVTQTITGGAGWVNFLASGKLVTAVNSPVVTMGSTDAQAYIYTGPVRNNSGQYYHNRDITIKPAVIDLGTDSATVRFYFLDSETELLINATGCGLCYKPTMAYELGVSKYSDADDFYEDGVVENDLVSGGWKFIPSSRVRIVPFDKGYYAEFKVRDFSEFWLNNGGFNLLQSLPLQLVSFNARKKNNNKDVVAEWVTASEQDIDRFEIEVAKGNSAYQLNQFLSIGQVRSQGNSSGEQRYSFTDLEGNKKEVRYYRLKIIENNGSFSYSPVRPVVFSDDMQVQMYPNPSAGVFNLSFQLEEGAAVKIRVYDMQGKTIKQYHAVSTGFIQKLVIDLGNPQISKGLYMLEAQLGERKQFFKIVKQ